MGYNSRGATQPLLGGRVSFFPDSCRSFTGIAPRFASFLEKAKPLILSERSGVIGTITLNNVKKRNALNKDLVGELILALEELKEQKVRAIILRAPKGSEVWSAGHDVHELPQPGRDPLTYDDPLLVSIRKIQYLPVPVLAMIEGSVWGGACDLAISCDILVGCPTTSFTMTPARIGVPYNVSGILHFMNLMPANIVREMFFTALPMHAEQA
jgi:methylmalonyl-CoA decarboxylase